MNENEAIQFYIERVVVMARSMPMMEAVNFLRGALAVAGDNEAIDPVRKAYIQLAAVDAQLELIANPQTEFSFLRDGKGKGKGKDAK